MTTEVALTFALVSVLQVGEQLLYLRHSAHVDQVTLGGNVPCKGLDIGAEIQTLNLNPTKYKSSYNTYVTTSLPMVAKWSIRMVDQNTQKKCS